MQRMKLVSVVLLLCAAVATITVVVLVNVDINSGTLTTKQTVSAPIYASRHESTYTKGDSPGRKAHHRSSLDSELSVGYIVANHYSGQQGNGVRALGTLQCLAGSYSLPVKIVEPFAVGSVLTSDFPRDDMSTLLKFRDLFDFQYFNTLSEQEAEPTLASWNEFLENAPRNVIVIHTHTGKALKRLEFKLLGDVGNGVGTQKLDMDTARERLCFSAANMENDHLNGFCVVRVARLTLPGDRLITDDSLYEYLYGSWDPRNVTLLFSRWVRNFWIQNPDSMDRLNCSDPKWNRVQHRLVTSQKLLEHAQFYTEHYLNSSNDATIMVRSEHILHQTQMRHHSIDDRLNYFKSCLQTAIEKAHKGVNDTKVNQFFLTLDISIYGSSSLPNRFEPELNNQSFEIMRNMVAEIYSDHLSFEDWEKSFVKVSDGIDNPAYIAALQRTIASQSSCLILVGGGNFQLLAVNDYLRLHPSPNKQCIHTLCIEERFTKIMKK